MVKTVIILNSRINCCRTPSCSSAKCVQIHLSACRSHISIPFTLTQQCNTVLIAPATPKPPFMVPPGHFLPASASPSAPSLSGRRLYKRHHLAPPLQRSAGVAVIADRSIKNAGTSPPSGGRGGVSSLPRTEVGR